MSMIGGGSLAQSFYISQESARSGQGVFLTRLDLFFSSKDTKFGVIIGVITVENGQPTDIVLTAQRLAPTEVNVSNTGATATGVILNNPCFLKAGKEYAVVISPEASSPEYKLWAARAGSPSVTNSTTIRNTDWDLGSLFTSTNGRNWLPNFGVDLKFNIYIAKFSASSGSLKVVNEPSEFLTFSSITGTQKLNQRLALLTTGYTSGFVTTLKTNNTITFTNTSITSQVPVGSKLLMIWDSGSVTNAAGTIDVYSGNTLVVGSGTNFTSLFAVGDFIFVNGDGTTNTQIRRVTSIANTTELNVDAAFVTNRTANNYHKVTPKFDTATALTVGASSIALSSAPKFNSNSTNKVFLMKTAFGDIDEIDSKSGITTLRNSTANTTYKFANGSYVVIHDTASDIRAVIDKVTDKKISQVELLMNNIIYSGTTITASAKILNSANTYTIRDFKFGETNDLDFNGVVRSKSNEIAFATSNNSIELTLNLNNSGLPYISPIVNLQGAAMIRYAYKVNDSTNALVNETTVAGNAYAKYISKKVVLADGQEAEDLKVYVSAYKPSTAGIFVYAKILNEVDAETFESKDWTLLTQVTSSSVFSSSTNKADFREFEFTFPSEPDGTLMGYGDTHSNTTIHTSTDLSASFAADDIVLIKIPGFDEYNVRVVASANTTAIEVLENASFTYAGVEIYKLNYPLQAYKSYEQGATDQGIVQYFTSDRGLHNGYKYVQIKVILASDNYYNVPRLDDVRAICCSV